MLFAIGMLAACQLAPLDHLEAARHHYEVVTASEDLRYTAEYDLGRSLLNARLPLAAQPAFETFLLQGPEHPYFLRAVEGLLEIAERIGDVAQRL